MYIVVFVTASGKKEAQKIADGIVGEKLAACVTIVESVASVYWWQGKIEKSKESLLIIKTKKSLAGKLIKKVKSLHSYTVPEVIALPVIAGNKDYLDWIHGSTT
jgi:periplasmic divalent cation tolerance protein